MRRLNVCLAITCALAVSGLATANAADPPPGSDGPAHGFAMHGKPALPADFTHFPYVNPDAPKGGTRVSEGSGTYDSLNPFIIQGTPASGITLIYDTLMEHSIDEPFTLYCHVCETIEVPDGRGWVEFTLRADARWHDGKPVTPEDVVFTFNALREKGAPSYRFYYGSVAKAEKTGDRKVKFTFGKDLNPELPLILGELPVLPAHYWAGRDFTKTTLETPLGSGPYRIADVQPGRSITYRRVDDYWAKGHPTQVGRNNVDMIRIDYYRDRTVAREAFKGGNIDIWIENSAKEWATAFDTPAVRNGAIRKVEFPHERTAGMQGFVFNLRKPMFQDRRVRLAIAQAFDFETYNETLAYGAYTRTDSYFDNSELGSRGLLADADAEEREILERYRGKLPEGVYTEVYQAPTTDGPRGLRTNLRTAQALLKEAGWEVVDGVLRNKQTGRPFEFEVLLVQPTFEKMVLPMARSLERLGIKTTVRTVDTSQYIRRVDDRDFDMVIGSWGQSQSPGNEQRDFWSSAAADAPGSRNLAGIEDPVIDELIELVITAPDRDSLIQRTRALDRALLWGYYVIPHFHLGVDRIAYWNKFGIPDYVPLNGEAVNIDAWWIDAEKAAALNQRRATGR
jgi:microcin C transport system substrate-binding protein